MRRPDAEVLGLFGTGNQAFPNCRAICAVRPIKRVKVFSPNAEHRQAFIARMEHEKVEVIAVDDPREVVRGAHIVCCATNAKVPVLNGEWLETGQMVVTIVNSDVLDTRSEVDEATFARANDIIVMTGKGSLPTIRSNCSTRSSKASVNVSKYTSCATSSPAR